MDFEVQLIELVKAHPFIYDRNERHYSNKRKKIEAWNNIAKELGCKGEVAKKRWRNLRDSYIRAKRRSRNCSDERKSSRSRTWRYSDNMSFLENVRYKRLLDVRRVSSYDNEEDYDDDDNDDYSNTNMELETTLPEPRSVSPAENIEDSLCSASSTTAKPSDGDDPAHSENNDEDNTITSYAKLLDMALVSLQNCTANLDCAQISKDSTTSLFDALDKAIKSSNLTRIQLTEIESSTAAFVYQQLIRIKNAKVDGNHC